MSLEDYISRHDYKELLRADLPRLNAQPRDCGDACWEEVIYWRAEAARLKYLLTKLVKTINEELDP
jgi:hypothetical protein